MVTVLQEKKKMLPILVGISGISWKVPQKHQSVTLPGSIAQKVVLCIITLRCSLKAIDPIHSPTSVFSGLPHFTS